MPQTASPSLTTDWLWLRRWMRAASIATLALIMLVLGFLPFLETLWGHWLEYLWAALVGALSCFLLVAQYRLAGFVCPRCGGHWLSGPWSLANPLMLYRSHCHHCGETPSDHA